MFKKKRIILVVMLLVWMPAAFVLGQKPKPPIMGWSSWNHFHIDIDEGMIRGQADAMISSGLYAAGYSFINIDDGYFGAGIPRVNFFRMLKNFLPACDPLPTIFIARV